MVTHWVGECMGCGAASICLTAAPLTPPEEEGEHLFCPKCHAEGMAVYEPPVKGWTVESLWGLVFFVGFWLAVAAVVALAAYVLESFW